MNVLVVKLGATGDVVRTTPLLGRFDAEFTWITAQKNRNLLEGLTKRLRAFSWEEREAALDRRYDLAISLEDEEEIGAFLNRVEADRIFGAYLDAEKRMCYTADSRGWFDLSLISVHGRAEADCLKLINRQTYQELVFAGLGLKFQGEKYRLPKVALSELRGDVAISPVAGPVWPMKGWAYYPELQLQLEARGFRVNVLPTRPSLLEHLADVQGHRCLVSGDSLPMHLALGSGVRCVTIFNCTSPWEIHDYGIQTKLVSPLLHEFFYKRQFDERATKAVSLQEVFDATLGYLNSDPAPVERKR
jgi:hypothetical protein